MRLHRVSPARARVGQLNPFFHLLLAACALLVQAGPVHAQSVANDEFSANRFSPAPGAGNYLMVDGAGFGGHLTPSLGVLVDYAHRPFVLYTATCPGGNTDECEVQDSDVNIVAYQLTFNPMGSITLWQRLQLGVVVPVVLTSGESFRASTPNADQPFVDIRGGDAFGVGDPRLSAKLRILGNGSDGFSMAAAAFMTAPLGQATAGDSKIGDDGLTAGGHLIGELKLGKISVAANAGGVVRPKRQLLSTEVGPELVWGLGGAYQVTSLVRVLGEVTGATQLTSQLDENPIETRVAGEITAGDIVFLAGGGVGMLSGVGVPVFRLLGGVGYRPAGLDTDGDGVRDKDDACPTEPEDTDSYLDTDGCPDLDNDGDGLDDTTDKCPNDPEDPDGFEDEDGCPDTDNDADGVPDGYDSCPMEPEDKDGDRDEDGCPDDDRDRDGIPDATDKCPDDPEDTDGLGDEDGCPEADFDGDGISDDEDLCPEQPENVNGRDDKDGCPDTDELPLAPPPPPTEIRVTCDKIEFPGKVYFKTNSDEIEDRSYDLLMQITEALNAAKHVRKVRIEGHTDSTGKEDKNLKLSEKRAAAVMLFLIGAGVDQARLESKGFGSSMPIADNKTKAGREGNRRVDFVIVEQDGSCK